MGRQSNDSYWPAMIKSHKLLCVAVSVWTAPADRNCLCFMTLGLLQQRAKTHQQAFKIQFKFMVRENDKILSIRLQAREHDGGLFMCVSQRLYLNDSCKENSSCKCGRDSIFCSRTVQQLGGRNHFRAEPHLQGKGPVKAPMGIVLSIILFLLCKICYWRKMRQSQWRVVQSMCWYYH